MSLTPLQPLAITVLASLTKAGIADRDIQTSNLNLNPRYRYVENQPPVLTTEVQRLQQAQIEAAFVQQILTADPTAYGRAYRAKRKAAGLCT